VRELHVNCPGVHSPGTRVADGEVVVVEIVVDLNDKRYSQSSTKISQDITNVVGVPINVV
jgi:hypothetical protein